MTEYRGRKLQFRRQAVHVAEEKGNVTLTISHETAHALSRFLVRGVDEVCKRDSHDHADVLDIAHKMEQIAAVLRNKEVFKIARREQSANLKVFGCTIKNTLA